MKDYNKYIKHIEETLIKVAPKGKQHQSAKLANYIGTKLGVVGVNSPLQRKLAKDSYGILEHDNWLDVTYHVYSVSNVFEVKNAALIITDTNFDSVDDRLKMEVLPDWIDHTDNWAHSDSLSKLYTKLLESEKYGKLFLKTLVKWNSDVSLWKRRQSLVSLYYYARSKKVVLPYAVTEKLIHNLLDDKEYFVQKGLGWTLRESFNVYPKETFAYVSRHANKISSIAFSAAVEKMSIKQKEVLKLKRKNFRIKK